MNNNSSTIVKEASPTVAKSAKAAVKIANKQLIKKYGKILKRLANE